MDIQPMHHYRTGSGSSSHTENGSENDWRNDTKSNAQSDAQTDSESDSETNCGNDLLPESYKNQVPNFTPILGLAPTVHKCPYGNCGKGFTSKANFRKHWIARHGPLPTSRPKSGSTTRRDVIVPTSTKELSHRLSELQVSDVPQRCHDAGLAPSIATAPEAFVGDPGLEIRDGLGGNVFPAKPGFEPPNSGLKLHPLEYPRAQPAEFNAPSLNTASGGPFMANPRDQDAHRIMNELVLKALHDLEVRVQITCCQKTTVQGEGKVPTRKRARGPANQQQPPSRKRQAVSQRQGEESNEDDNDQSSDDDLERHGPEDGKDDTGAGDMDLKYLACPLFRKDPRRYAACAKSRLRRIRDVKQHLRRKHTRPEYYCPTCWETYSGPDERDAHLIQRSCNGPEGSGPPWISREQDTLLEGRVPNGSTAQQWFSVWDIVCPGQTRPEPPFCFLGRMVEDISTFRRELWETKGSEIIEDLVSQREATLQEPLTEETRSLLQRCIMDAVRRVLEHPDVTQAREVRWNQDNDLAEAASVPQSSNRVHDVSEDVAHAVHRQPCGTQDNILQDGHSSIPNLRQALQLDVEQQFEDFTSFWNLQTSEHEGFDTVNRNVLDTFPP
ncbi:hypothetical protein CTAM01_11667 [Colletotrichum tamarilloi]|uniref:C2H2-type domain-containing protein n=1 Tax=Colletotrichum tamarilloi TaxID=1209934 RepID=A0ABQ9QX18_9PEZI|nr:uncharacterized protein CTAM01_11667 [Colletotrichum tamarilloi]KAK1487821.1 hypothetical protein CTAM01_11667 [Colletotrichum tamarilloi]